MYTKKLRRYFLVWFILVVVIIWILLGCLKMRLPAEYHYWNDDKYWHTAILDDESIVVPPTVIDHAVRGDYILALRVNRDMHFSKEHCGSCRTLSAPCAEYWVVNWKSKEDFRSMEKESFITFLKSVGIKFPEFEYNMPISALKACKE